MTLWRRSRIFRAVIIALAVFLLAFVAPWGYLYWRTERDLQAELTRIREAGEPTSLTEIVPPDVPDDENGALIYARYYAEDAAGDAPLSFARAGDEQVLMDYLGHGTDEAQVRRILSRPEVADALQDMRRASGMRYASLVEHAPGDGERFPDDLAAVNHAARFWLKAPAILAARNGQSAKALEWLGVFFLMGRQRLDDPVARRVAWVVGNRGHHVGWKVLEETPVPVEAVQRLLMQIPDPDPQARARDEILRLRAQIIDSFRRSGRDRFDWAAFPEPPDAIGRTLLARYDSFPLRPIRNSDFLGCLHAARGWLETIDGGKLTIDRNTGGPPSARDPHLQFSFTDWINRYPPVSSSWRNYPLGWHTLATELRTAARINIFRTGLALAAHKAQHGHYPQSLSTLDVPVGSNLTEDPFTGTPLKYRQEGNGFVIYSVGIDCKDDGGVDLPGYEGDIVRRLSR